MDRTLLVGELLPHVLPSGQQEAGAKFSSYCGTPVPESFILCGLPSQGSRTVRVPVRAEGSLDFAMGGSHTLVLKFALCSAGTGEDASPAMVQDEMQ
jgi:hypothetical protein